MFVQRRLAPVALAVQPEHIVAVEDAPYGGERVAPAEVDTADQPARGVRPFGDHGILEMRINETVHGAKGTVVLLRDPVRSHRARLLGEEVDADARAVAPGDAHLLPRAGSLPFVEEPAAPAERRR